MSAPTLFTLTGNLLWERTLEFDAWTPGKTQRARAESFQVGGKGINVSKMLNRLGTANTALCFTGGATGTECIEWLRAKGFVHETFSTREATRVGLVIRAPGQRETTFLGTDSPPDAQAMRHCAEFLETRLTAGSALALCGSFPGWDAPAAKTLRETLDRLIPQTTICADTYGPLLTWLVERPVALVKINRDEFDLLFTAVERDRPLIDRLTEARKRWAVRSWIITDGPREVTFTTADTRPASLTPPVVEEVSATGSGDVLFASVLHALLINRLALAEAVAFALPFASANAASAGIADFDLNNFSPIRSSQPHE